MKMKKLSSFFNHSEGKWISQRTTYELSNKNMNSVQSNTVIRHSNLLSNSNLVALLNWGQIPREITKYLDDQITKDGNFNLKFTNITDTNQFITLCSVTDASLITFKTRYGTTSIDETYWFATNNLRLSTSIVKKFDICIAVSFCSEIKV